MSSRIQFERDLIGDTSGHEHRAWAWVVSSARATFSNRLGWLVTAISVLGALIAAAPRALFAGPATFALLFVLTGLRARSRPALGGKVPILLPGAWNYSDLRARALIVRLGAARQAIDQLVDGAPRGPGFDLSGIAGQVSKLERHVVVLASRIEYLGLVLSPQVRGMWTPIREPDPADPAKMSLDKEAEALVDLAERTLSTLEDLPPKLAALQLRRLEACDDTTTSASADATCLLDEVRTLSEALSDHPRDATDGASA